MFFNNRDDHAKNFSYRLEKDRRWKLSPAYDLTFSSGPGGEHQMDIFGEGRTPGHSHLMGLAEDTDLDLGTCQKIIDQVIQVAKKFKSEAQNLPIRQATINEVFSVINKNLERMKP